MYETPGGKTRTFLRTVPLPINKELKTLALSTNVWDLGDSECRLVLDEMGLEEWVQPAGSGRLWKRASAESRGIETGAVGMHRRIAEPLNFIGANMMRSQSN